MAGALLLGVVLACGSADETDQANKLVAEGNSVIDEGKKFFKDAEAKKTQMLQTDVSRLAEARTLANEAIRGYDQAEEKAKAAAGKFEEASKLKISDKFKEYLSLKVKEFNKRAELIEAARGIAIPKSFSPDEQKYRKYSKKSIVASQLLPKGSVVKESDLIFMRAPELGLPPDRSDVLIGRSTKRDIPAYELVVEHDLT